MNKKGISLFWEKLVAILLAILVLLFLLFFAYYAYNEMMQTPIPGLV